MVLGSAQYKRQHDYGADSPPGGGDLIGAEDDARVVHSERELFMANQARTITYITCTSMGSSTKDVCKSLVSLFPHFFSGWFCFATRNFSFCTSGQQVNHHI